MTSCHVQFTLRACTARPILITEQWDSDLGPAFHAVVILWHGRGWPHILIVPSSLVILCNCILEQPSSSSLEPMTQGKYWHTWFFRFVLSVAQRCWLRMRLRQSFSARLQAKLKRLAVWRWCTRPTRTCSAFMFALVRSSPHWGDISKEKTVRISSVQRRCAIVVHWKCISVGTTPWPTCISGREWQACDYAQRHQAIRDLASLRTWRSHLAKLQHYGGGAWGVIGLKGKTHTSFYNNELRLISRTS